MRAKVNKRRKKKKRSLVMMRSKGMKEKEKMPMMMMTMMMRSLKRGKSVRNLRKDGEVPHATAKTIDPIPPASLATANLAVTT